MRTRSDGARSETDVALDEALARAVLYRALGSSLRRLAAQERRALFSPAGREALLGAAALLDARQPSGEALRPRVEEWAALGAVGDAEISESHDRLFGHSRGLVCAFEMGYGPEGGFEQPQALADIAGSYRAFGLAACGSQDERVDHVACECEFLCFMARKEAYTLGLGPLDDELTVVRSAERGFLKEHLGRFGRAFASRLLQEDPRGFFGALGSVLFAFLTHECRRFSVSPGLPALALRTPSLDDDAPLACGSAGGCAGPGELIQVQRQRP